MILGEAVAFQRDVRNERDTNEIRPSTGCLMRGVALLVMKVERVVRRSLSPCYTTRVKSLE